MREWIIVVRSEDHFFFLKKKKADEKTEERHDGGGQAGRGLSVWAVVGPPDVLVSSDIMSCFPCKNRALAFRLFGFSERKKKQFTDRDRVFSA